MGVVLALFERSRSDRGQVIDSAMVDGAANLAAFLFGFRAAGLWSDEAGTNLLDTGAPFYDTYETKDGKLLSIACAEPRLWEHLCRAIGKEEFGETEAQDVAVDCGNTIERPLGSGSYNNFVYFFLFRERRLQQLFHKRHVRFSCTKLSRIIGKSPHAVITRHRG